MDDDDVTFLDEPCAHCGHDCTRGRHCFDCNEFGEVPDCCDDLCQGDECIHGDYRPCPECGGTQWIRWCPKCGKDANAAFAAGAAEENRQCAEIAKNDGQPGEGGINLTNGVPSEISVGIGRDRYDDQHELAEEVAEAIRDRIHAAILARQGAQS